MFTAPKRISPFYDFKTTKLPRKFKKKWKHILSSEIHTFNQKMWYILGLRNPAYRDFIISEICKKYNENGKIHNLG